METKTPFQNWIRKAEIGRGGTACVFLVEDPKTGKTAVLKEVRGAETLVSAQRAQLRREAQMLQKAVHPRIPTFYEFYETSEAAQLFMAYIPGENAEIALQCCGSFSTRKVLEIGLQTSVILKDLHRNCPPILHGDLKPSNLLLHPDGSVYLLDFGTSGNGDSCAWGTVDYAAPEQCVGGYRDVRSDLYALGRTLQHLRYGADFFRKKLRNTVWKCRTEDAALAQVLFRLTRSDPTARYGNAEEVERAFADLLRRSITKRPRLRRMYHAMSCTAAFVFFLMQGHPLFKAQAAATAFVQNIEKNGSHSEENADVLREAQRLCPDDPRPITIFLQQASDLPVDVNRAAQLDALWAEAMLPPSDGARLCLESGGLLFFQYVGDGSSSDPVRERLNRSAPYFAQAALFANKIDLSEERSGEEEAWNDLLPAFLCVTSFYRKQVMQVEGADDSVSAEQWTELFSALSFLQHNGEKWLHKSAMRRQYGELWLRLLDVGCFEFPRIGLQKKFVLDSLKEVALLFEKEGEESAGNNLTLCHNNLELAYAAGGNDEE